MCYIVLETYHFFLTLKISCITETLVSVVEQPLSRQKRLMKSMFIIQDI